MGKFLTVLILMYLFGVILNVFLKPLQKYRKQKRNARQAEQKGRKRAAEERRWQRSFGYRGCQKKGPNPYDYHHSNHLDSPDVKDREYNRFTCYSNSSKKTQPGGSPNGKSFNKSKPQKQCVSDTFKRPPELRCKPPRQEYDDEPEEGLVEFDKERYMEEVKKQGIDLSLTPDDADIIKDLEEENYVKEENALEQEREAEEEKIEAMLAQEAI